MSQGRHNGKLSAAASMAVCTAKTQILYRTSVDLGPLLLTSVAANCTTRQHQTKGRNLTTGSSGRASQALRWMHPPRCTHRLPACRVLHLPAHGPGACMHHLPVCKVWLEVDGCAEEVKGAGGLLSAQVHQAEVVRHHPLKRLQEQRTLQAGDCCYVALQCRTTLHTLYRRPEAAADTCTCIARQLKVPGAIACVTVCLPVCAAT